MTNKFELGPVFEGQTQGKPTTVVVTQPFGKAAIAAITPDRDEKIILRQDSIAEWKEIKATARDYYLEAVAADGQLVCSLFIPGFEAARTFSPRTYQTCVGRAPISAWVQRTAPAKAR